MAARGIFRRPWLRPLALCAMVVAAALGHAQPVLGRTAAMPPVVVDLSAIDEAIASRRLEVQANPLPEVGQLRPPAVNGFGGRPVTAPVAPAAAPAAGSPEPAQRPLPPPGSAEFYTLFPPPPPVPAHAASAERPSEATAAASSAMAWPAPVSAVPVARPAIPVQPRFAAPALRRPALQRASLIAPGAGVRAPRPADRRAALALPGVLAPAAKPVRAHDSEDGRRVRLRLPYPVAATELSSSAQGELEALAVEVGGNDRIRLRLAAYANAGAGSAARARRTSLARALAVRGFLIERGIKASRIDLRALGNMDGAAGADRVDVVLSDK